MASNQIGEVTEEEMAILAAKIVSMIGLGLVTWLVSNISFSNRLHLWFMVYGLWFMVYKPSYHITNSSSFESQHQSFKGLVFAKAVLPNDWQLLNLAMMTAIGKSS